jgi:hypothetical protein
MFRAQVGHSGSGTGWALNRLAKEEFVMNPKKSLTVILLGAACAWAGPPLICEKFEIGNAKSLPWTTGKDWQGADPSYNVARLSEDTLALLTPSMPIRARMETLRRAAIYAAREAGLADQITARLLARTADAAAAGKTEPLALFDAGYFVETVRQASFVYRYNMLSATERTAWKIRGDQPAFDGYPWVQRAMQLGGKDMSFAASLMTEFRNADLQASAQHH